MRSKSSIHKSNTQEERLTTDLQFPSAPSHLGAVGKECWKRTVEILESMKVLDAADAKSVEAFSAAYEEYLKARKVCIRRGYTYEYFNQKGELAYAKRPEVDIMNSAWQRMRSLLPDLYQTPASRLKKVPPKVEKKNDDPFAEFLTAKN